jgi:hypothetical protein
MQMATFRKQILALLAFALLGTGLASAQGFAVVTCVVTSVVPLVRSEGLTELTGDIRAQCTNTPGAPIPPDPYIVTNFSVALNTNITNTRDFGAGGAITDAVLIMNENNYASPTATSTFNAGALDTQVPIPQYGERVSDTRLEWNGAQVPQPGGFRPAGGPGPNFPIVTQLRFGNIRANVSQLGVAGVDIFPTTQVIASLSITSNVSISFTQNSVPVGAPIRGLSFSLREADPFEDTTAPGDSLSGPIAALQCLDVNVDSDGDLEDQVGNDGEFYVRLSEGFATAFKTLGVPTFQTISQTRPFEAGYCSPGSGSAPPGGALPGGFCTGGGATQGTRFIIRFFNVPDGVQIATPNWISDDNGSEVDGHDITNGSAAQEVVLRRVANTNSNGAGGSVDTGGSVSLVEVDISGGFGFVVYEVVAGDPSFNNRVDVRVVVFFDSDTTNDEPAIGSMQVSADFAPLSTVGTSQTKANLHVVPRFIETNAPRTALSIIKCNTTILFPFVTNQAGFDTGLAISNTSKDWLGTDPQNGTCTIHYHGETTGGGAAPADQTSIVINGGEQLIFTLSGGNTDQGIAGAPDFQGYVIAVCEFQFGHGYAFITDGFGGIPNLAQGYLALILETTSGQRKGLGKDGSETLGH